MLQAILNSLFACSHRNTSFPLTPNRRHGFPAPGAGRSGTYVVCLDCGKEFAYDWNEMRLGAPVVSPVVAAEAQPEAQPLFR